MKDASSPPDSHGSPPDAALEGIAPPQAGAIEPAILMREPLLDASENLIGYELKLDPREQACLAGSTDINAKLLAQLAILDLNSVAERRLLVVGVDSDTLLRADLSQLPGKSLILAVRLPRIVTPALATALKQAWAQGHCIALDDYAACPEQRYLLDAASYIRLDASRFTGFELARECASLLETSGVRLIATHVGSRDEFDACRQLPFDYFQGEFFTTPRPRPDARLDQSRMQVFEVLNLVREKAELSTIERVMRRDPTLVYRLLRYINSPGVGLNRELRSIGHALLVLGYQPLYRWLTLLLFAAGPDAPRNRALLTHALVRGRLAELLGSEALGAAESDGLFVTGIFSLLDSLLGMPLRQALSAVRLAPAVTSALLENSGIYAPYLQLTLACEGPNRARVYELAEECRLKPEAVNAAHFEALQWAEALD